MLGRLLPRTRSAFESRTQVWRDAGLGAEIDPASARRNKGGAVIALALIAGVLVLFSNRKTLFPGYGLEVKIATVVLLVLLGWGLARTLGRGFAPSLYRRLEPGTAGTIGFLVRLLTILVMTVVALRIAGSDLVRWRSAAGSPRSSSAWPPSRCSGTCSPASS